MFRKNGKQVFYNDSLKLIIMYGLALLKIQSCLGGRKATSILFLKNIKNKKYPTFIYDIS
jgi:hypothetical protein